MGRVSTEKNPLAIAQAVRVLPREFRAVCIGDTHYQDSPAIVTEMREMVGERLHMVATQPHVGNLLGALDVMVAASHEEGCSIGLMEAWLAGVPTVSTDVGAVPELEAKHGKMTVHVPLNPSAQQLAEAVLLLQGGQAASEH